MAYIVRVEVGKGRNRTITQSIPLHNKSRVWNYIKRHPLIKSNTNVKVTNTLTKKYVPRHSFHPKVRKVIDYYSH